MSRLHAFVSTAPDGNLWLAVNNPGPAGPQASAESGPYISQRDFVEGCSRSGIPSEIAVMLHVSATRDGRAEWLAH